MFDYLDDFYTTYLNNILIYSDNPLKYKVHVKLVLQKLRNAGLQVDIKKCEFGVTQTKYLGFIISINSVLVDLEKVLIIRN